MQSQKLRVTLFLVLILACSSVRLQESGWFWQNPLPQSNNLWDAQAFDVNTVIEVDEISTVIKITDENKNWTIHNYTGETLTSSSLIYNEIEIYPIPSITDSASVYFFAYKPSVSSIEDSVISTFSPTEDSAYCRAVAVDGNDNIYAGYHRPKKGYAVIFKSTDSGVTWDTVWFGSGSFVSTIFIASNDYLFAGQYLCANVIRSTDGGITWDTCLTFKDDKSLLWQIAEDTLRNLFIGEYSFTDTGIYRATIWKSTNHGTSWDTIFYDPNSLHIHITAVDPYTNYIYASSDVSPGPGRKYSFLRSTDGGSTWDTLAKRPYTGIAFSPNYRILGDDFTSYPNSDIFITANDTDFISVHTELGAWTRMIRKIGDNYYAGFFLAGYTGELHLLVSNDEGQTWSIAKNYHMGYPAHILHIADKAVDGWIYYTYVDSLSPHGRLRKFRETVFAPEETTAVRPNSFFLS